ncbi:MAG: MafI family immunity protein [Candidatus Sumerlaeia bacterium]
MFSMIKKFFAWMNESEANHFCECVIKIIHSKPPIFNKHTMSWIEVDAREEPAIAFETICDKICDHDLKISREVYDRICECRRLYQEYYHCDPKRVDFIDESYVTDRPVTTEPDE